MTCQIKHGVDFFIQQQKELQFVNLLNLQYQREASAVYFYHHYRNHCCGSESGSVSTCFWASWVRIHYSEVWIRIRIWLRIRILLSLSKNSKKNLDSYCFVTSF
jgi:hypothetical protein